MVFWHQGIGHLDSNALPTMRIHICSLRADGIGAFFLAEGEPEVGVVALPFVILRDVTQIVFRALLKWNSTQHSLLTWKDCVDQLYLSEKRAH